MAVNYRLFSRWVMRADELAKQPGIPVIVARVYEERLKGPGAAFLTADAALTTAMSADKKEGSEADAALAKMDKPYSVARAAAKAYLPHLVLPETLKAVKTDTDKMDAIEELLEVVEANATEGWAQDLLNGEFGELAPRTVQEIDEAIRADATLAAARQARADAYGPAWEEYLSFKRVVRTACGPRSWEYRRIHQRSAGSEEPVEPTPPEPPTPPVPPG